MKSLEGELSFSENTTGEIIKMALMSGSMDLEMQLSGNAAKAALMSGNMDMRTRLTGEAYRGVSLTGEMNINTQLSGALIVGYKETEWVPLGVFWSGDWEVPQRGIAAKTTGRDMLERLRNSTFSTSQVYQDTTLYALAGIVLADAGLESGDYWIDIELQDYTVPYAWFTPMSHREALRKIVEACMGQCYCDREGIIRIEGPSFLEEKLQDVEAYLSAQYPALFEDEYEAYGISVDDYFQKNRPMKWGEVANYVEVSTAPLKPAVAAEEVYRSNSVVTVPASGTKTVTCFYNSTPCVEALVGLEDEINVSVTDATYYAWGAVVELTNAGATDEDVTVKIDAKPLTVQNKEKVIAQDTDSIIDNGMLKYTLPENSLIQTLDMAQNIADKILASQKDPRRDVVLDWRGNPALELTDIIVTPDWLDSQSLFYVTKQTLTYRGSLRSTLEGRKV
jgi:hypothetical protein